MDPKMITSVITGYQFKRRNDIISPIGLFIWEDIMNSVEQKIQELKEDYLVTIVSVVMSVAAFVLGYLFTTSFIVAGALLLAFAALSFHKSYTMNKDLAFILTHYLKDKEATLKKVNTIISFYRSAEARKTEKAARGGKDEQDSLDDAVKYAMKAEKFEKLRELIDTGIIEN